MPRNGSGSYQLPAGNPVVTQTLITSNWANTTMNDLAAAITQSLSKDGQTVPTANLPMGGFIHTGVGDPVLRDNYASLGWVQDGKDKRLTGVTGTNQIEAVLPGGQAAPVVGQIVQLIPVQNNTGAVTLRVNSGTIYPVVTDLGSALGAGNLVLGRTYLLSFTGAAWQIISASGGVTGFAQAAMSGWDRPGISAPYPAITFVNPTTVNVPAGTGRIIRPSARDLSGVREVAWAAQNVTLANVAVDWSTFLAVNSNGQIIQLSGNFSPAWSRDYILLGNVAHVNGQINEITTQPAIFGDMTYAAYDTATILNNTLVSGGKVLPNAASPFHIDLQAGVIFSLGADSSDVNGPNTGQFPAAFDLAFFPVTGTSGVGAATQNVPVTNYDPSGAGIVTAIPGGVNTASIHRLFLMAGEFIFVYGQNVYADLPTALSQLGVDDAAFVPPAKLVNATLLCYIVAQKNTTDLKNTAQARIVAKGGTTFSIGTAGSISEAPINGLIYGRVNASWAQTVPAPVGAQATLRQIYYYTNTFARFSEGLNDTPEGGLNTGSDWVLRRYTDAGGLLGTVMTVQRSTGDIVFETPSFSLNGIQYVSGPNGAGYPCLNTYQDGKFSSPFTSGNFGGIGITALDTAADAGTGITFRGQDSPTTERPGAVIAFGKDGPWAPLGGDYPGFLSFQTRSTAAGGGQTLERLRIDSAGRATFSVTPFVGANPILVSGGAAAFSSVTTDLVQSSTGILQLATAGVSNILLRPQGAGVGTAEIFVDTNASTQFRGSAAMTVTLRGAAANQSNLVFSNVTTGELGRVQATANTLTFQTGAAPATRLTLNNASADFTIPINTSGASSHITSSADVRANSNFASSNTSAVFATSAAGNVRLRPNGTASGVGELLLASTGAITANGTMTSTGEFVAANFFATTNGNAIFGPAGSGNVILRPQGPANATGQLLLTNGGEMRVTADYVATGLIATLAATGAGSVRLRPNGVASAVGEVNVETSGRTTVNSTLRVLGQLDATTGTGMDFYWTGSAGTIIAINRATAVWQPIQLAGSAVSLRNNAGGVRFSCDDTGLAFFAGATAAKQTVTGSRAGNAALTSLLTALALYGLITNSSSA